MARLYANCAAVQSALSPLVLPERGEDDFGGPRAGPEEVSVFVPILVDTGTARRHNADRGRGFSNQLPGPQSLISSGCPSWMHDPDG